jgi:hypothetical protein
MLTYRRTTNPIESTFSTVRLWTKVTRGAGSRADFYSPPAGSSVVRHPADPAVP